MTNTEKPTRPNNFSMPHRKFTLGLWINGELYRTEFGSFYCWILKKFLDEHPEKFVKVPKEEIK